MPRDTKIHALPGRDADGDGTLVFIRSNAPGADPAAPQEGQAEQAAAFAMLVREGVWRPPAND